MQRLVVVSDVSGKPMGPIFNGQLVEDETSVNYQPTLRNIPEEWRPHLHRGGSFKSLRLTRTLHFSRTQQQFKWNISFTWDSTNKCTSLIYLTYIQESWPLKMKPKRSPETSVRNLRGVNIPENDRIQVNRGGSLRDGQVSLSAWTCLFVAQAAVVGLRQDRSSICASYERRLHEILFSSLLPATSQRHASSLESFWKNRTNASARSEPQNMNSVLFPSVVMAVYKKKQSVPYCAGIYINYNLVFATQFEMRSTHTHTYTHTAYIHVSCFSISVHKLVPLTQHPTTNKRWTSN
jgi:hypothetical protein